MGTAQAGAVAIVCAARRGLPVGAAHPERGEGGGHRQRAGGQGPGHGHGDAAAADDGPAAGRPDTAGRAGAGHLPPVAGRHPGPAERPRGPMAQRLAAARTGCRPAAAARRQRNRAQVRDDLPSERHGRAGSRRTARSSRWAASGCWCSARPAHWPRCAPGSTPRVATSLVVREDALTLLRFRLPTTSGTSSSCSRPPAASGPGWRWPCWPCSPPDALRRARAQPRTSRALTRVARYRPERCATDRPRTRGPPGRARHGEPRSRPIGRWPCRAAQRRRGASRCGPAWSAWAGRPRDADQAIAAVEADLAEAATGRRVRPLPAGSRPAVMLRAALRTRPRMTRRCEPHVAARCCGPRCGNAERAHEPTRPQTPGPGPAARAPHGRGDDDRLSPRARAAAPTQTSGVIEGTLRPKRLNDFIGQARVREQLSLRARRCAAPRQARPTTCCCPARPGWARPPSP